MQLNEVFITEVSQITGVNLKQTTKALSLLLVEECTIPFISRYRKEATGELDEVQLASIKNTYEEIEEREKRRHYILETLEKSKLLTDELKKKIVTAKTLQVLEDIYAPYKSKKKTKGKLAKEAGIEPLAMAFKEKSLEDSEIEKLATDLINKDKGYEKAADVINGAMAIIIEEFSHNVEAKETLRNDLWKQATLKSSLRKEGKEHAEAQKFKDYFEFEQPLKELLLEKNTHRFLAMRRAMSLKILKLEVCYPSEVAWATLKKYVYPQNNGTMEYIEKAIQKAYSLSVFPSLDLEIKSDLKKSADEAAIKVFGVNLKSLLLQPFLGSKSVLGIDPGVRTGCKIVVVDDAGNLQFDTVIYPHPPQNDTKGSQTIIEKLVDHYKIAHIAVGNGTYGRETLSFLKDNVEQVKKNKCHATLINEAGASIYSASDIARKEFPDKDVTVRGAVSIARRFQDPLAELVKIDPKSIGVGQYQHDVNQSKLKKNLQAVVESCVNHVGVDLNTASGELLSYVSGIGPSIATNVVKFRAKNGLFTSREQLKEVTRFSDKIYTQAAGFLRIKNSNNPLDNTSIHPENYTMISKWCDENKLKLEQLVGHKEMVEKFKKDNKIKESLGQFTHADIVASLLNPGDDPRDAFEGVQFREDAKSLSDIKLGQWYPGVVTNITKFGAFVDIGIKENGLLHISQMAEKFVEDPFSELKVGQEVKVRVIEVDAQRGRLSLSRKNEGDVNQTAGPQARNSSKKGKSMPDKGPAPKSPFAALAGLKLK